MSSGFRILTIPLFSDNYAYAVVDTQTHECAVVDPAEPDKIVKALEDHKLRLTAVLTTHSHWDHAGGNKEMLARFPDVRIYGGPGSATDSVTHVVGQGDVVHVGSVAIETIFTPCHTPDHVCFLARSTDGSPSSLFTGDTLFVAGCGNFNSGTPAQMYDALVVRLGTLPPDTHVYAGHEYTLSNLRFAAVVEPENLDVALKLAWAQRQRDSGLPTVPSTIADELKTNPFMRVGTRQVAHYAQRDTPVEVMAEIRRLKTEWGRRK